MNSDLLSPLDASSGAVPRRVALRRVGLFAGGLALTALPTFGLARGARSQTAPDPTDAIEILNFALTLEYLDGLFYQRGLDTEGLIPSEDRDLWAQLNTNETGHRQTLISTIEDLGGDPVTYTFEDFDYTAIGGNPFADYALFAALGQAFEDTGTRAYKGQAAQPAIMGNDDLLTAALRIHSVEARHAAAVRRLRKARGLADVEAWITLNQTDGPIPPAVYAGDENVVQGPVNLATLSTLNSVDDARLSESFDEPLTAAQVLAIADPFIVGTPSRA